MPLPHVAALATRIAMVMEFRTIRTRGPRTQYSNPIRRVEYGIPIALPGQSDFGSN